VGTVVELVIEPTETQKKEIASSASASFVASTAFASAPFETWRSTSGGVLVRSASAFADVLEALTSEASFVAVVAAAAA